MPGMLIFAFFATLLVLRLTGGSGSRLTSGVILMAIGVWILWSVVTHRHGDVYFYGGPTLYIPHMAGLLIGVWLVVKGALRASSY